MTHVGAQIDDDFDRLRDKSATACLSSWVVARFVNWKSSVRRSIACWMISLTSCGISVVISSNFLKIAGF
jgi:hypothetical protein